MTIYSITSLKILLSSWKWISTLMVCSWTHGGLFNLETRYSNPFSIKHFICNYRHWDYFLCRRVYVIDLLKVSWVFRVKEFDPASLSKLSPTNSSRPASSVSMSRPSKTFQYLTSMHVDQQDPLRLKIKREQNFQVYSKLNSKIKFEDRNWVLECFLIFYNVIMNLLLAQEFIDIKTMSIFKIDKIKLYYLQFNSTSSLSSLSLQLETNIILLILFSFINTIYQSAEFIVWNCT